MLPEPSNGGVEASANSGPTVTNNDQQQEEKSASLPKPESSANAEKLPETNKVSPPDRTTADDPENPLVKVNGAKDSEPEKKRPVNDSKQPIIASEGAIGGEEPKQHTPNGASKSPAINGVEQSKTSDMKLTDQNKKDKNLDGTKQRTSSPLLLEDDELLKTDEVLPDYDFGPDKADHTTEKSWDKHALPCHLKFLASKKFQPGPILPKVQLPAASDSSSKENQTAIRDADPLIPGTERAVLNERAKEKLAEARRKSNSSNRPSRSESGFHQRKPPPPEQNKPISEARAYQGNADVSTTNQNFVDSQSQRGAAAALPAKQSLQRLQPRPTRPDSHSQHQPRNQVTAPPQKLPPNQHSQQPACQKQNGSSPAPAGQAQGRPQYHSGHHYGYSYTQSASLKPIRRLAKIRPYANQAVPVSAEEIQDAIPEQSSAIFHIMDRRVNLDAFDLDETCADVKVPVYQLLRAWVQDDPYRQVPPSTTIFPEENQEREVFIGQKRQREEGASSQQVKKHKATVDVTGYIQKAQNARSDEANLPPIATLKEEMIQEGRKKRVNAAKSYKDNLAATLKSLQDRGILRGKDTVDCN